MDEQTYTLQSVNVVNEPDFQLEVSYDVYLRMRRYLDEHELRYKIIITNEYIGKDKGDSQIIGRTCILQFRSFDHYHEMVKELVSFETNVLNNK